MSTTSASQWYSENQAEDSAEQKSSEKKLRMFRVNTTDIGAERTPGCFVCDGGTHVHHTISAFIESKEDGELIVASIFHFGAILDRLHEPSWIQIKIGACDAHLPHLKKLRDLTADGYITPERVTKASSAVTPAEFQDKIRAMAYLRWESLEKQRRDKDKFDATAKLVAGRIEGFPSREEIERKSRELWLERKESQAFEDWINAHAEAIKQFEILT